MEIETNKDDGVLIIKPLGKRIDTSTSTAFKGKVVDLVNQGNNQFILDLSEVEFMDSSGLGATISLLKTVSNAGGAIYFCNMRPPLVNLFAITRMDKVFNIAKDLNDAKQQLSHSTKHG